MKATFIPRETVASALIVTLALIVVVTILAIGMLSMSRVERASASHVLATTKARMFSDMAADHALTLIRDTITAAEATVTNPVAADRKFWVSQPGKITVFNADGSVDNTLSRELYSTNSVTHAPKVDLNAIPFGGKPPIMADDGNGAVPPMEVAWINVIANPASPGTTPSSSTPDPTPNPVLVGRYAFWVDDESTKLNINTADGTTKGTDASFGAGTPAEVSLLALSTPSREISEEEATNIATKSGSRHDAATPDRPFNSILEIRQAEIGSSNLFDANYQDITTYSRSPDLNIFGEPKIYLTTAIPSPLSSAISDNLKNTATPLCLLSGSYAQIEDYPTTRVPPSTLYQKIVATGRPLTWLYPSSGTRWTTGSAGRTSQLPGYRYQSTGSDVVTDVRLPQYFRDDVFEYVSSTTSPEDHPTIGHPDHSIDYEMGMRIARYIKGWNSQGNPLQWPAFGGSGGFGAKYTDRQIDDITSQILSQLKQMFPDHYWGFTLPYFIPVGYLSGKPVRGASRSPRLTEVVLKVTTVDSDPPQVKLALVCEFYLPKEFGASDIIQGDLGNWKIRINYKDLPIYSATEVTKEAPLGKYWVDNLLTFTDQDGNPAGVDLFGNPASKPDPDQERAQLYHHPWALKHIDQPYHPTTNPYMGSGKMPGIDPLTGEIRVVLGNPYFTTNYAVPATTGPLKVWKLGEYLAVPNPYSSQGFKFNSDATSITVGGGLSIWLIDANQRQVEGVPLDGIYPSVKVHELTEEQRTLARSAAIPIPGSKDERTIPIPGMKVFHMQVADPLVNSFPGDWQGSVLASTDSSEITIPAAAFTSSASIFYKDGLNTISRTTQNADPESIWWPQQDLTAPKSRRFPSSGYLQYIRTGAMPDPSVEAGPPGLQKGTPWRMLNYSPSTASSQQTSGGISLPDWLLLELFTTPAILQPLGNPLPPPIIQTWGGATAGRINPNGILHPFNLARTRPLEALFKDVPVVMNYNAANEAPVRTYVDGKPEANGVISYIRSLNRPLMLPGEICNVPEIAAYIYRGVPAASRSRNDLVRSVVGNLTTRSNTFTIWAAGEVIQKKRGNTNYTTFEPGDTVASTSRMRYVVERYLNPGDDGVYGNSVNLGADQILNTPDDPTTGPTGAHPTMNYPLPYKYRIISVSAVE